MKILNLVKTSAALAIGGAGVWIASFCIHSNFEGLQIQFVDEKGNIESVPDFKVEYKCSNTPYAKDGIFLEGLHAIGFEDDGDKVVVNYGGLGRRRGLRNFKCLDS